MEEQRVGILDLASVVTMAELVEYMMQRPPDLPGFGVLSGCAGMGKTTSAIWAVNQYRAYMVRCRFTATQRGFCEDLAKELGLTKPERTIHRMVQQIGDHLADHYRRPLIIDEADHLVRRRIIEIVRDIYEGCAPAGASIILVGEQALPAMLKQWERIDSRVLRQVQSPVPGVEDARVLANRICPALQLDDGALTAVLTVTRKSLRRMVSAFFAMRDAALLNDWREADAGAVEEVLRAA